MDIQLTTDNHVSGNEKFQHALDANVRRSLEHFAPQLTRIEVHLSDQNGDKEGGNDKRCVIEARIAGRQPIAASHDAPTIELAIDGALERLIHMLTTVLAKAGR